MKKVTVLIIAAALLIVGCLLYLLRTGIGLSPALLIKPSTFTQESVIAPAVVQRLFPQLSQYKNWVIRTQGSSREQDSELLTKLLLQKHPQLLLQSNSGLPLEDELKSSAQKIISVERFKATEFSLSSECNNKKRLNYRCFVEVSLHKSRRKMKNKSKKYFLMTSYLDTHYLILIQEP